LPVSKLKNLALLILVLANLALLVLLVPGQYAEQREAAVLRQSLSDLYAREQVRLDPDVVPDTVTLYALELGENSQAALQAATVLLGEDVAVQDDSTRYQSTFQSDRGQVQLGRSGSFQAQVKGQKETSDPVKTARRLLEQMGFQCDSLSAPVRLRAGVYTVTAAQAVLGVPVFSEGLTLTFSNSALSDMQGVFYTGTEALTRSGDATCLSAADALVSFLSARYDLGWVGSAVTAMEQGYLRLETASAAATHLTPCWRLETDTGSFYIDGITGEITAVP